MDAIQRRAVFTRMATTGILFDAFGGPINRVAANATAFVHRDQRFLGQYFANLPNGASPATVRANRSWLEAFYEAPHPSASGHAYQNYIDPDLAGWRYAQYGANRSRLERVKSAHDPDGVFRFAQSLAVA